MLFVSSSLRSILNQDFYTSYGDISLALGNVQLPSREH